jgi:hypothetical protein
LYRHRGGGGAVRAIAAVLESKNVP